MIAPYYEEPGITIYCADCRDVLPQLEPVDLVLTDPPYPKLKYEWEYVPIESLGFICRGFYFWLNPPEPFPLLFTSLHIWSKANIYRGDMELWESIYEVNGQKIGSVLRESAINSVMSSQMNRDIFYEHPTQKPLKLIKRLINRTNGTILDPFMGSGTTLVAAKFLGRKSIGIEIEERYCQIAVDRLRQGVLL